MAKLEIKEYESFEGIKQIDENDDEYWFARDLQKVLNYSKWENFSKVIDRAMLACKNSGFDIDEHFIEVSKMIEMPAKTSKKQEMELGFPEVRKTKTKYIIDYKLTRYACYLIVQNGDPRKKIIAVGQTYFAIQTRRQELADTFNQLDENNKRLVVRGNIKQWNQLLAEAAHNAELIANLFRISQTEEKLKLDKVATAAKANETHLKIAEKIRKAMIDMGTTLPENLPTPDKSIQIIEREEIRRLRNSKIKLMLDE